MKDYRDWYFCTVCMMRTYHDEKGHCLECKRRKLDLPSITGHARKQEQKDADNGDKNVTATS
jgi:hypothetical protein